MKDEGNVVLAYTSDSVLMLDCDLKREDEVLEFAPMYAKYHNLGNVLIMKISDNGQVDLYGNKLGNYAVVFGRVLSWGEIRWHVQEAYRLRIVNKSFLALRDFGSITIRVSDKNNKIPYPNIVDYFSLSDKKSDRKGVMEFLRHWVMCRKLGK